MSVRGKFGLDRHQIRVRFIGRIHGRLTGLVDDRSVGALNRYIGLSQRQGKPGAGSKPEHKNQEHPP
jgi:hypothetical protein